MLSGWQLSWEAQGSCNVLGIRVRVTPWGAGQSEEPTSCLLGWQFRALTTPRHWALAMAFCQPTTPYCPRVTPALLHA